MRGFSLILFVLLSLQSSLIAAATQGDLHPVDLRCEYRKNPLGIDAVAPRLSWKFEPSDMSARGLSQSAYQILVSSNEPLLARNQGDVWDSGKVNRGSSIQVAYGGKALSSGEAVWWKVRVWDNDSRPSVWSEPAHWSMGLLAASDWKGKWIGFDGGEEKPAGLGNAQWISSASPASETIYLRHTFEIPADNPLTNALLFMVGSGPTTLTINGGHARKSKGSEIPFRSTSRDSCTRAQTCWL